MSKLNFAFLISYIKKRFKHTEYKKFLPGTYLKLVILGFALTGLKYTFLPGLEVCSSVFGTEVCDPLGNYIVTYASFPGYLFSSVLLYLKKDINALTLISGIIAISLLIYFLLGLFIDKLKKGSLKLNLMQWFIVILFLVLTIAVLLLI